MKILVAIKSLHLLDTLLSVIGEIGGIKSMGHVSNAVDANGLIDTVRFDVLIVEILLRGGSGFGVLAYAKKISHRAKIIMVTDAPYVEYKNKALELGADYFFNIDQDFDSFHQTLKSLGAEFSRKKH